MSNELLGYVLNLFADPAAADEYRADPEASLSGAGLSRMCSDDMEQIMPVLLDHSPISFDRNFSSGGNTAVGGGGGGAGGAGGGGGVSPAGSGGAGGGGWGGGGTGGGGGGGGAGWAADHAAAVQQLTHVLNSYSYTTIDDRDYNLDNSVNQAIFNNGFLHQNFDNDLTASFTDDRDVDNSTVYSNSFNDNSTDDHSDNSVDDHSTEFDVDVDIEDSFNTDNSTGDDIEDSLVVDDVDVDVNSGNTTTNTSTTTSTTNTDNTDNSIDVGDVDVEYYEESIVVDDIEYDDESINDSIVVEDVTFEEPVIPVVVL
jgi:hypothetical protein